MQIYGYDTRKREEKLFYLMKYWGYKVPGPSNRASLVTARFTLSFALFLGNMYTVIYLLSFLSS
jgi:hypothetical protein